MSSSLNRTFATLGRRIRLGVIGGGPGSFIGPVHRAAARLDDNFEVVASVLSSHPERSVAYGLAIGIAEDRAYADAAEMLESEASREDGIEAVAIMTPNDSHYPLSVAAIDARLDIICDKPLSTNLADAVDLMQRVRAAGVVFCQTFNYSGFPMVRQARAMIADGDLGPIRQVHVEYVQGHNAALTEGERGDPPANWHFRPEKLGPSLILGDIGSHAHHLVTFVTGLQYRRVLANIAATVPGRNADDYAGILFTLENGASGTLWVTQAAAGGVHGLHIRVYGETGGLEWFQEEPNRLFHSRLGAPAVVFERGGPGLKPAALASQRVGIGHPEGYQEAFAVLYAEVAEAIVARRNGEWPLRLPATLPTVEDGVRTMQFIEAALESSRSGSWTAIPPIP
jgi:predicted dehydrogenase